MKTIYFITGNKGKVLEANKKLSDIGIEVIQKDIGYPEIQADSLEEVAQFGVDHVQKQFNHPSPVQLRNAISINHNSTNILSR